MNNAFNELKKEKERLEYYKLMLNYWLKNYDSQMACMYLHKSLETEYRIDILQAYLSTPQSNRATFLIG
jgi:hypothetical protein